MSVPVLGLMWKAVMLKLAGVYASLALEVSVVSHTALVASMENHV